MTHPFFDQSVYPLSRPEAQLLLKVLQRHVTTPQKIDFLYRASSEQLPPLNLDLSINAIWQYALDQLARFRVLRRFCELCQEHAWVTAEVHEACVAVIDARSVPDTPLISDNIIMLDRDALRGKLSLIASDDEPEMVLLVRGEIGTGKSYSRHLFERVARYEGADFVYVCNGMIASIDDLLDILFSVLQSSNGTQLPLDSSVRPLRGDTTESAWHNAVCLAMFKLASARQKPVWIAVDDLGLEGDEGPLIDREILRFCHQFGLQLMNPAISKWFRLMLIHYPNERVPTNWAYELSCDVTTKDDDVDTEHVEDFLRTWGKANRRQIPQTRLHSLAQEYMQDAERALDAATPDGHNSHVPRLRRIHKVLSDGIRSLDRSAT